MGWLLLNDVHDARLCDAWFSCTDYPIVDVAGNGATLGLLLVAVIALLICCLNCAKNGNNGYSC